MSRDGDIVGGRGDEYLELLVLGIKPFIALASLLRCISTASVRPRLRMNGKGCAGSTAMGVRIGNMWVRNSRCRAGGSTRSPSGIEMIEGITPIRTSLNPKVTVSAAIAKSQAATSPIPPLQSLGWMVMLYQPWRERSRLAMPPWMEAEIRLF